MLICLQNFPVIQATHCWKIHTDRKVLNQESSPLLCPRRTTLFAVSGATLLLELFPYHGKEIKFDRTLLSARGSYSQNAGGRQKRWYSIFVYLCSCFRYSCINMRSDHFHTAPTKYLYFLCLFLYSVSFSTYISLIFEQENITMTISR